VDWARDCSRSSPRRTPRAINSDSIDISQSPQYLASQCQHARAQYAYLQVANMDVPDHEVVPLLIDMGDNGDRSNIGNYVCEYNPIIDFLNIDIN
jgi:hypothetical protein